LICTGDRDGNIRLWLKPDDDLVGLCARVETQKFKHLQVYKSSTQSGYLVTRAFFMQNNLLITGTNNGDVRFWQMQVAESASRAIGRGPLPTLTLRYDLNGIHNGAVELLTVVGDVLLSSGGNDGKIVGWDISTGRRLGFIRCHPGRRLEGDGGTIRSCVVDLLVSEKDSLISLCRDGTLKLLKM
jgi:WD40 repeat protein